MVFNFHDKFKARKLNISCSANKLVFRFSFRFPGTAAHEEVYRCTNSIKYQQEGISVGCGPSACQLHAFYMNKFECVLGVKSHVWGEGDQGQ